MKLANALKKLEKLGHNVEKNGNFFRVVIGEQSLQFCANGVVKPDADITCVHTCSLSMESEHDSNTDYFPETFHDNLSQALKFIEFFKQKK